MGDALRNRVIVITGASSGIGLATARRCVEEGAQVVALARGRERLETRATEIGATPVVCDIADPDSVRSAFCEIEQRWGGIHALLNIAGSARIRRIEDAGDDDIASVFGANLLGPIYTSRAAIPLLRRSGGGDIINVSSEITDDYMPFMVLYGASKGGLDTFTRMMSHELKHDRIRVCNYVSGSAISEFGSNFTPEEISRAYPAWEASGYLSRVAGPGQPPEWLAEAFVFILTRPPGQTIDVARVRSFGPGHG
jgi:NAD(P)-dependent dehydrogenase (short-subunit alcohol dehydrogenase family)